MSRYPEQPNYGMAQPDRLAGANDRQVDGSHYKSGSYQHWDFIVNVFGPSYLIGCATKYIVRHAKKNGLSDIEKADHYLEKLIEVTKSLPQADTDLYHSSLWEFVLGQDHLTVLDIAALERIICYSDFEGARSLVKRIADSYLTKSTTSVD